MIRNLNPTDELVLKAACNLVRTSSDIVSSKKVLDSLSGGISESDFDISLRRLAEFNYIFPKTQYIGGLITSFAVLDSIIEKYHSE